MKIPFVFHLLFAVLLISGCTTALQEQEIEVAPELALNKKVVITARIGGPETKVSYFEDRVSDPEGRPFLHQQWNIGDWVYGFYDKSGHRCWMYLQVTGILEENGERIAVLSPSDGDSFPETGYIHLFYCGRGGEGGPEAVDLYDIQNNNELAFNDFSDWSSPFTYMENPDYPEDNNVAGIMTADAEVRSSVSGDVLTVSADLTFENQMAIIGIEGIQVDPGAVIDRIELSGVRTGAVYSLETVDGKPHLVLDAGDFDDDQTVAVNLDYYPQADEEGKIMFSGPLFIAVYPSEGEEGTEGLVLRARMSGEDETEFYYYTYILGPKTIEKGKYYYIPTKQFEAPEIPVARVDYMVMTGEDDFYWEDQTFLSLDAAFAFVNTNSQSDVDITLLCNYTANNLRTLTGNYDGQCVRLILNDYSLTLDGCSLSVAAQMQLIIPGGPDWYNWQIFHYGNQPVVSVSEGVVTIEKGITMIDSGTETPFQVSGNGSVSISGGRFSWNSSNLIAGNSSEASYIMGGRYSKKLSSTSGVVLGYDGEEPWKCYQDGDSMRKEENGDPYCPFVVFPESVFNSLAHTEDDVLKTFSSDEWGNTKIYLTRNNLYKTQDEDWAFEGPNWTLAGQVPFSESHVNRFTYNGLYEEFGSEGPICVDGGNFEWMNLNQWDALLNSRSYRNGSTSLPLSRYLKCKVQDADDALWRNLLVFPDEFEWPAGSASTWKNWDAVADAVNVYNLSWEDSPIFTVEQAEVLLAAGFVFMPAAIPVKDPSTFEVVDYRGAYWTSNDSMTFVFTDSFVGYQNEGDTNHTMLSLHAAYPCE